MALKGARRHLDRLKRLAGRRMQQDIFKAFEAGAERIRDEARASIIEGGIPGAGHIPPRPGEPPNSDTGELARSIGIEADPDSLSITISASAPYAADLEFGSSKVAERPFLAPAVSKHRESILNEVAAAVRKTIRKP